MDRVRKPNISENEIWCVLIHAQFVNLRIYPVKELRRIYGSLVLSLSVVFLETHKLETCFAEVQHWSSDHCK
jgi:hypothetical protein